MDSWQHCQDTGKPRVREWTPANNATLGYQNIKCQGVDSCKHFQDIGKTGAKQWTPVHTATWHQNIKTTLPAIGCRNTSQKANHRHPHPRISGHQESGSRPLSTHYPSIPDTKSPGADLCQQPTRYQESWSGPVSTHFPRTPGHQESWSGLLSTHVPGIPGHQESGSGPLSTHFPRIPGQL